MTWKTIKVVGIDFAPRESTINKPETPKWNNGKLKTFKVMKENHYCE